MSIAPAPADLPPPTLAALAPIVPPAAHESRADAVLRGLAQIAGAAVSHPDWFEGTGLLLQRLVRDADVARVFVAPGSAPGCEYPASPCRAVFTGTPGVAVTAGDASAVGPQDDHALAEWTESLRGGRAVQGHARALPEAARRAMEARGAMSAAWVPVQTEGLWWGVLGVETRGAERTWSVDEMAAFGAVAAVAGAMLDRHHLEHRLAAERAQGLLNTEVGAAAALGAETLEALLRPCAEAVARHLDAALVRVWTVEEDEDLLRLRASAGMYTHLDGRYARVPRTRFRIADIDLHRRPVVSNALDADGVLHDAAWARREGLAAYMGYPLVVGDSRVVGVIALFRRTPIHEADVQAFTSVGDEIAMAIESFRTNARSRERGEQLRTLVETAPDGIVELDAEGAVCSANAMAERLLGSPAGGLEGRRLAELLAPEGGARFDAEMRAALAAAGVGARSRHEVAVRTASGDEVPLEVSLGAYVHDGRPRLTVFLRDLTERREAEARARELAVEQAAKGRAEFLAEASRLLGTSFDPAVMLASLASLAVPALADLCHVDLRAADGGYRRVSVAHVDPAMESLMRGFDMRPDVFAEDHPTRRALQQGESSLVTDISPERIMQSVLEPGRREMMMRLRIRTAVIVPLRIGEAVAGVVVLGTSDSGRDLGPAELTLVEELARRASMAIENARLFRESQDAIAARDEILAIVAHDLRNPLNTIMMASDLLREQLAAGDRAADRKHLGMILRNAEHMNRLIGDLLEVKRVETGRLVVEPRPSDLGPMVVEAMEMLYPMAAAASLTLGAAAAEDLPAVRADAVRIQQVLSNLVGNAIKFTPAGGRIEVRAELHGDAAVRISVADTGPGIAADQLPQVFGRFWQGGHRDRLGVGLGLAICKGIIEAHGGEIWVESVQGEGTTFAFWLPLADAG
jgi:PAS domain S-box-containing protein